ncbi:MAG TPA: hydantoinase B/oxoprolinase family protein [Steroidobacteraceae bacterium]|nr:hydantoinase B/oxoprolinase family protein [Steroidobacteraceae bacterium]
MRHARPLERQIQWNRLLAIVEEQAQALLRTSFSTIVRECGDLSAGVFDLKGRMLAQAVTGTPGHVNTMAESVGHFCAWLPPARMSPGDVYVTNDPWKGTGHLNDFVVMTPVFHRRRLVAFFAATSHVMDVGGLGFGPDGRDLFMEGLSVPFLKLVDRGEVNATLMAMLKANTRIPVELEGDLYSLVASNDVGARRLVEMLDEFRLRDLSTLAGHIIASSHAAVLKEIARVPKGRFRSSLTIDGKESPITLAATVTIAANGVTVDYSGTSPTSSYGINVPLAYTTAYTVFGLHCALARAVPNNAGSLAAYRVTAPAGCILNPERPRAVSSRHIVGQMLPDVVFGCLRQAIPDRVPAEGTSCLWMITVRGEDAKTGSRFATTVVTNGGTGARPGADGLSATAYPSGVRGTPVEIVESMTPLIFWRKDLRPQSGGDGEWRGGDGLEVEIENRSGRPLDLLAAFDRIEHPPRGRDGGGNGAAGTLSLKNSGRALAGKGTQQIPAGEILAIRTPGGGGLGDPARRRR